MKKENKPLIKKIVLSFLIIYFALVIFKGLKDFMDIKNILLVFVALLGLILFIRKMLLLYMTDTKK